MTNVTYSQANLSNMGEITSLFRNTIQTVNTRDYSAQEIEAWSRGADNIKNWVRRIETHYFILAKIEHKLVGMASIDEDGYLDVIYLHPQHQGMGIAKSLLNQMIDKAKSLGHNQITSDVSITAKPFFIYKGFEIIKPQLILCRGVVLRNYNVRLEIASI